MLYDVVMNYERVQAFFRLYPTKPPQTVSNNFLSAIRALGRRAQPMLVIQSLSRQADHAQVIIENPDEAIYVAEYYIAWERLSKKEKRAIQENRRQNLQQLL